MRSCPTLLAILVAGSLAAATLPASAQSGVDPATGTVCGLINFAFCPQGIPPTPLPDPEGDAERTARPARAPVDAAYAPPPPAPVRAAHRKRHRAATAVPPSTDDR